MTDIDKVIKGLTNCVAAGLETACPADCPYFLKCFPDVGLATPCMPLMQDALAALKEQEAKQAIKQTYHVMINRDYENPVVVTRYDWLCPTCKSLLCRDIDVIDDNYHFCKVCGQAVKFDDI